MSGVDTPMIRALRPFALAGFAARPGGAWGELPDDCRVGVLCGVPIYARDVRAALQAVEERSPVTSFGQQRRVRLSARLVAWLPHLPRRA